MGTVRRGTSALSHVLPAPTQHGDANTRIMLSNYCLAFIIIANVMCY